jgi:asparagine synthase (glutamine-hydrolysing)
VCGIVGCAGAVPDPESRSRILARLRHRGPDDAGQWLDGEAWLGHTRLAIVDLSAEGHQPMQSPGGRFSVTFNGEVYNHPELRGELIQEGIRFRGHSDTEVLAAAIEAWGLDRAVERFIGMFAFGVYDRVERSMWLVRDRLGIKPLYFATAPGRLAFASELTALALFPWIDQRIDPAALHAYFRYLCVPAPATILRGVRKLEPGTMLRWDGECGPTCRRYWDLETVANAGRAAQITCSFDDAADDLEGRLRDSIRLRMRADVPLGAFLSGGVDSSLVAALMRAESTEPVHTHTIGFEEASHDEAPFARQIARHLETEHHEHVLAVSMVPELVPEALDVYDEPFADGSCVPTFLLSRHFRQHAKVALSGDGGDELFGGYPRYFWAGRIQAIRARLSPRGARLLATVVRSVPDSAWALMERGGARAYSGADGLSARARRLAGYLACEPDQVYEEMMSAWREPHRLLGGSTNGALGPSPSDFAQFGWAEQMIATDQKHYLVDDILTKVDRASMAVSLEVRVPLLDHRLVEWSWRVPLRYKMSPTGDRGKLLLRHVLYRHVPAPLIERPKMGFGMPMTKWLRTTLRPWAEDILRSQSLRQDGMLNYQVVDEVWRDHLAGRDRLAEIWTVLAFHQWQLRRRALTL